MCIMMGVREEEKMNQKVSTWFFIIYWAIVLVLTLLNKMMLSMDLMAIGMLLCALERLIPKKK